MVNNLKSNRCLADAYWALGRFGRPHGPRGPRGAALFGSRGSCGGASQTNLWLALYFGLAMKFRFVFLKFKKKT